MEPKGWYSRGYLPHFDGGAIPQMVTFHLAGSLPENVLTRWREELAFLPHSSQEIARQQKIEAYLDAGRGPLWLRDPRAAAIVETALLFFDGKRYSLHAWVVMPNHVHALVTPVAGCLLAQITHSWKSFTAHAINHLLGRDGHLWEHEAYDRYIRNQAHYDAALNYIEQNPVKAGLCSCPYDWNWSSARRRGRDR